MTTTFQIKRLDRDPPFERQFRGVDLTGCTVLFVMGIAGQTPKVSAPATIVAATEGKVSYAWGVNDTSTVGKFTAEWVVTAANGHRRTFPADGYDYVQILANLE